MVQQVKNYLQNDVFFAEIKKTLNEKKVVRIRVRGNSMLPFIRHNDYVSLVSPIPNKIRKGSIVVAYTDELGYVMHRIAKIKDNQITLLGDGNTNQYEHTDFSRIIAMAKQYERGDRTFSIENPVMHIVGLIWLLMHPWRKKIVNVLWKIKMKLFN